MNNIDTQPNMVEGGLPPNCLNFTLHYRAYNGTKQI